MSLTLSLPLARALSLSFSGDTTPCRMTGVSSHRSGAHKDLSGHSTCGPMFSSFNLSDPMHMIVCGMSTSGALPQRIRSCEWP